MAKREPVRDAREDEDMESPPRRESKAEPKADDGPVLVEFPKMKYHAQLRGCIVQNAAEEAALAEGWVDTLDQLLPVAPVLVELEPASAVVGDPSFDLLVHGSGFAPDAVIVFNGVDEPTTVVSDTVVSTGVNMPLWQGPSAPLPVLVKHGNGQESNALTFTFLAAPPPEGRTRRCR